MFVEETGSYEVGDLWDASKRVVCISVGYLEVRGVIARRLSTQEAGKARRALDDDWDRVEVVEVDDRLVGRAARIVDMHRLRSIDALHLAAAVEFDDPQLVIATWDAELARAARTEGIAVAPTG